MYSFRKVDGGYYLAFALVDPSGIDGVTGLSFSAGDVQIATNSGGGFTGGFSNTANLPTEVGNGIYQLLVTGSEFYGNSVFSIIDQSGTKLWLDKWCFIDCWGDAVGIPFDFTKAGEINDQIMAPALPMSSPAPTTTTFSIDSTVNTEYALITVSGAFNGRSGFFQGGPLNGRAFFINSHTISAGVHSFEVDVLPQAPNSATDYVVILP